MHEFLVALRGEMNERRTQVALQAFALLDEDVDGVVDGDVLLDTYEPAGHPDVVSGKRTETAVTREFLDTFDGADKDGDVTPSGFLRYSANVSATIDSDEEYEAMMRGVWQLPVGDSGCRRVVSTLGDRGLSTSTCIHCPASSVTTNLYKYPDLQKPRPHTVLAPTHTTTFIPRRSR